MSERDQKVYSISDMDAYRDGLNSIHAEEVATLRAQLLAARAEAFEEAAKMAEDMWDNGQAGAHGGEFANRLAAALRAKGAGK